MYQTLELAGSLIGPYHPDSPKEKSKSGASHFGAKHKYL